MARLKEYYDTKIIDILMKKFDYQSIMQVPKLVKITLNMGKSSLKLKCPICKSSSDRHFQPEPHFI